MKSQGSKQAEIGVIDNLVSDNVIMNGNVIIRSGKELASEDEASSSHTRFSPRVDDQGATGLLECSFDY